MTLAEMMEKTRTDKEVGHPKEQMTIPPIFQCPSRHYEKSTTEVEKYQHLSSISKRRIVLSIIQYTGKTLV
jgi:hypothetical protein